MNRKTKAAVIAFAAAAGVVGIRGGPGSGIAERTYHAVHDYFDPPRAHKKTHAKPA